MGDDSGKLGDSGVIELTGKIMVVTVLVLVFVVVLIFCLHLYAKWFLQRRENQEQNSNSPSGTGNRRRRRRRFDFAGGYQDLNVTAALKRGLDPSVLKTIPIVVFSNENQKELKVGGGLECAVCLCEVSEGEKMRFLPKCKHGFHVECIDMWFQSHSTCPLCRNPVSSSNNVVVEDDDSAVQLGPTLQEGPSPSTAAAGAATTESLSFPTNVLYWGNETQVSILGEGNVSAASSSSSSSPEGGMLVIDIPRMHDAEEAAEEQQQKTSPLPKRLRSFKRLLSSSRDNTSRRLSPRGGGGGGDVDLEQQQ
ncbi:OLC1v1015257C1 [Oldenlandia corymbosa var. corymbosa]|uniref:RING-type E3 ubiquitin transferase n=1 Tax=Oldenlandia corymbosa var. corymbosa TaxID=529605 RepID=A0AAV1E2S4_OLDCO|nr:OLC1v1015257C1 [Oldenlandia corymbosa var. corymbosa]